MESWRTEKLSGKSKRARVKRMLLTLYLMEELSVTQVSTVTVLYYRVNVFNIK